VAIISSVVYGRGVSMKMKKMKVKHKRLTFVEDLIENLPIGMMILDQDGKIIHMNKAEEATAFVDRGKVLGRTFQEAFPRTLEQGLRKHYFRLLRHGVSFDIIIDNYVPQYFSKKMTYHARGASLSSKKNFILLHELEEELYQEKRLLERRTKELQESKIFLEALIDSSPYAVISTDLADRILIFNKMAERLFNYSIQEVKNKNVNFLFPAPGLNRRKVSRNNNTAKEILCVKKNQSTFPASLQLSNVRNTADKIIAKLYLFSDLTEKKDMEERLLLSEKLALYSELMGGIAHQLNNPLIGVINFSEMLLKEIDEQDSKKELVETISRAGKECLKIIVNVLNSLKDPKVVFTKTDINEVLQSSLKSLKEQFVGNLNNMTIKINIDQKLLPILGDGVQLKQCFLNIMTNAVQVMENRGHLSIETRYDEKNRKTSILFSDTGPGIPKEFMNKLFLPFFSLPKRPGRHGLGLSFAFQIVKNHGGHIQVKSELGKGSTFTVVLPNKVKKDKFYA
jgi:PAS domain S-box-containing protein